MSRCIYNSHWGDSASSCTGLTWSQVDSHQCTCWYLAYKAEFERQQQLTVGRYPPLTNANWLHNQWADTIPHTTSLLYCAEPLFGPGDCPVERYMYHSIWLYEKGAHALVLFQHQRMRTARMTRTKKLMQTAGEGKV